MQRFHGIRCVLSVAVAVAASSSSFLGPTNGIELGHTGCNDAESIAARNTAKNEKVSSDENDVLFWSNIGNGLLHQKLNSERQYGVAKNVIFFIGDGMSITTLTSARIYMGQLKNKTGESEMLSFEKFPFTGLSKTYCVDSQVADSACSATAYLTGVKGNIDTIGVTGAVSMFDCMASIDPANQPVSSMKWAQLAGKRTGVVSNMRVTHATPAGAYANIAYREWECDADIAKYAADPKCLKTPDIARQLIEKETGRNLNVVMGGGRSKFLPSNSEDRKKTGNRIDNRNLISEWLNISRTSDSNSVYIENRSQLKSLNTSNTDYLLGLFAPSHMNYSLLANKTEEPTLVEMTEAAIKVLSKGKNGYYLFVEGGLIDWAHHENYAHLALDETVMLSKTVERAVELTSRKDTLIVVTSDHSHTMTLNGYPHRGSNILGHPKIAKNDKMPYSTLSYANGPSAKLENSTTGLRYNLTNDNWDEPEYRFPSLVNIDWETHGGDDVAVFALGPWAHLFVGNYEQNFIPFAISYAAQMGPGAKHERRHKDEPSSSSSSMSKNSISFEPLAVLAFCVIVAHLTR